MDHPIPSPSLVQQQQPVIPPPSSAVVAPAAAPFQQQPRQQQQFAATTVTNPVSSGVEVQVPVPITSSYPPFQASLSSTTTPLPPPLSSIQSPPPTLVLQDTTTIPTAPPPAVVAPTAPPIIQQHYNGSLNGCWILDKTRGEWSMKRYLEVMLVDPLAIEAHSKGEIEFDTIISIEITSSQVTLIKRSRVNNDIVVTCPINEEQIEYLPPGNRIKKTLATLVPSSSSSTTNDAYASGILQIHNSLHTMNGLATVIDKRIYIPHDPYSNTSVLRQELTIINEETKVSHTTIRFFNPIPSMDYNTINNKDESTTNNNEPSPPPDSSSLPQLPLLSTTTTTTISNTKDTDVVMEDTTTTVTTAVPMLSTENSNPPFIPVVIPTMAIPTEPSGQQQQPAQGFLPSLLLDQQQQHQPTSS